MGENQEQATFLLMTTRGDLSGLAGELRLAEEVVWASPTFGPYCLIAYAQAATRDDLASFIERVRIRADVDALDARLCKPIPGDDALPRLHLSGPEVAVLLITVDYRQEKERDVAYSLRANKSVRLARVMWGPADIIAVVEAPDHETLRNVICDEIKVTKGVSTNTTLYCYPQTWPA